MVHKIRTGFRRPCPDVGQVCPNPDKFGPGFDLIWQKLAIDERIRPKFGQVCSDAGQICQIPENCGPSSTKFGPNSVNLRAEVGLIWPTSARFGPSTKSGPCSAESGPESTESGPTSTRIWPDLAKLGRDRPLLARSRRKIGPMSEFDQTRAAFDLQRGLLQKDSCTTSCTLGQGVAQSSLALDVGGAQVGEVRRPIVESEQHRRSARPARVAQSDEPPGRIDRRVRPSC